jgi:rRNA-processing protein FCF1
MGKNTSPIKKHLPYNFRSEIVKTLSGKGVQLSKQTITDILGGVHRNPEITQIVLVELKKLAEKNKKKMQRIKKLKSLLK